MNKKGFTVIELVTTIALVSIVASLLIQMALSLSKMYDNTSLKTELYYKQSLISKDMNEAFLNKSINYISSCGTDCLLITYIDSTTKEIRVEDNFIFIGDNSYEIVKNSEIGEVKIDNIYSPNKMIYKDDTILNIRIPITYKGLNGDFGINLVYQYNRSIVSVEL